MEEVVKTVIQAETKTGKMMGEMETQEVEETVIQAEMGRAVLRKKTAGMARIGMLEGAGMAKVVLIRWMAPLMATLWMRGVRRGVLVGMRRLPWMGTPQRLRQQQGWAMEKVAVVISIGRAREEMGKAVWMVWRGAIQWMRGVRRAARMGMGRQRPVQDLGQLQRWVVKRAADGELV